MDCRAQDLQVDQLGMRCKRKKKPFHFLRKLGCQMQPPQASIPLKGAMQANLTLSESALHPLSLMTLLT